MNKRYDSNSSNLEELLWQAEQPPQEPEEPQYEDEFDLIDEDDLLDEDDLIDDVYLSDDFDLEEPEYFQNYANGYGTMESEPEPEIPEIQPDYNLYQDIPEEPYKMPKHKSKRRRGCGCGCLTPLILLILALVVAVTVMFRPPQSEDSIGTRKRDTATILICGTDEDGTRTDTMMLMYLSGSEKQVRLLSLPRDTYTITASGKAAKLNSAYGRNGCGEEGMEVLMDYVQRIIGYRPDGYILVDFTLVPQIVDIMGGVDFDVPMDMDVASVAIEKGYQHLSGKQLMTLLRFRKGYATADLGRVEVQREVLKACLDQWLKPQNISNALEAVKLVENNSISSLNTGNYIWIGKTLLLSMKNFGNDTLPGYADYRGNASYYILNKSQVADMINEFYNPYKVTISPEDLNIAG